MIEFSVRFRCSIKASPAAAAAKRPPSKHSLEQGVKAVALGTADVIRTAFRTFLSVPLLFLVF